MGNTTLESARRILVNNVLLCSTISSRSKEAESLLRVFLVAGLDQAQGLFPISPDATFHRTVSRRASFGLADSFLC